MIVIRADQMAGFEAQSQFDFRARIVTFLNSQLPQLTAALAGARLDGLIRGWQARADEYGVRSERGIALWCYLCMILAEDWDKQPPIADYLRGAVPPPDAKIDAIIEALEARFRAADAAARDTLTVPREV